MRIAVVFLCLLAAACQASPSSTSTQQQPTPGTTSTVEPSSGPVTTPYPRTRETFGGRCSPYASNCW